MCSRSAPALQCDNPNCITGDPAERQYAANKFYVIEDDPPQRCRLRCVYCENDIGEDADAHFVVADAARKTFSPGLAALAGASADKLKHLVIYPDAADALAAGFGRERAAKRPARVKAMLVIEIDAQKLLDVARLAPIPITVRSELA